MKNPGSTLGWTLGALGLLIAGCSSSDTTGSGTSADQASTDVATAYCNKINSCAPVEITFAYGTVATGITDAKGPVSLLLGAPMTSLTPDREEACATAATNAVCADILAGVTPTACLPQAGTIPVGSACGDDNQCVSAFCPHAAGSTCGICATAPADNAACVNNRCPNGLTCVTNPDAANNNTCVTASLAGQPCADPSTATPPLTIAQPCVGALTCYQGKCITGNATGADCDLLNATHPPCSILAGSVCDGNAKKCVDLMLAAPGGACGLVNLQIVACQTGNYCKKAASADVMGVCAASAAEGAGCNDDPTMGAPCLAPATCDSGVCKIADPSTCK